MPEIKLPEGYDADAIAKLKKTLTWLLGNLDHWNVRQLFTEYCKIQSENGETELLGPLLIMKDGSEVLRLYLGLDKEADKFLFELYDPSGKKTVYLADDGTQVLDGQLLITFLGKVLLHAFKDTNGGVFKIFDNNGNLNVKIGVEGVGGQNIGGTAVFYNDSPDKPRVAIATSVATDSGVIEVLDSNNRIRAGMSGEQSSGEAGSFVYDASGVLKSCLRETYGTVNEQNIATEDWVRSQGYINSISGASGYFTTADGKTVAVSNGLIVSIQEGV